MNEENPLQFPENISNELSSYINARFNSHVFPNIQNSDFAGEEKPIINNQIVKMLNLGRIHTTPLFKSIQNLFTEVVAPDDIEARVLFQYGIDDFFNQYKSYIRDKHVFVEARQRVMGIFGNERDLARELVSQCKASVRSLIYDKEAYPSGWDKYTQKRMMLYADALSDFQLQYIFESTKENLQFNLEVYFFAGKLNKVEQILENAEQPENEELSSICRFIDHSLISYIGKSVATHEEKLALMRKLAENDIYVEPGVNGLVRLGYFDEAKKIAEGLYSHQDKVKVNSLIIHLLHYSLKSEPENPANMHRLQEYLTLRLENMNLSKEYLNKPQIISESLLSANSQYSLVDVKKNMLLGLSEYFANIHLEEFNFLTADLLLLADQIWGALPGMVVDMAPPSSYPAHAFSLSHPEKFQQLKDTTRFDGKNYFNSIEQHIINLDELTTEEAETLALGYYLAAQIDQEYTPGMIQYYNQRTTIHCHHEYKRHMKSALSIYQQLYENTRNATYNETYAKLKKELIENMILKYWQFNPANISNLIEAKENTISEFGSEDLSGDLVEARSRQSKINSFKSDIRGLQNYQLDGHELELLLEDQKIVDKALSTEGIVDRAQLAKKYELKAKLYGFRGEWENALNTIKYELYSVDKLHARYLFDEFINYKTSMTGESSNLILDLVENKLALQQLASEFDTVPIIAKYTKNVQPIEDLDSIVFTWLKSDTTFTHSEPLSAQQIETFTKALLYKALKIEGFKHEVMDSYASDVFDTNIGEEFSQLQLLEISKNIFEKYCSDRNNKFIHWEQNYLRLCNELINSLQNI